MAVLICKCGCDQVLIDISGRDQWRDELCEAAFATLITVLPIGKNNPLISPKFLCWPILCRLIHHKVKLDLF